MLLKSCFLSFYEVLWIILIQLLRIYALISKSFALKLQQREAALVETAAWMKLRARYPRCVLFVCSSAGEYEQAKPLIKRFSMRGDTASFILFYSASGIRFAGSQKETTPFSLVTSDRPSFWRKICTELRPDAVLCIRYELWPGMMSVVSIFAPVYLINGVEAQHLREKIVARRLRAWLITPMKSISIVSRSDAEFYQTVLGASPAQLIVTGDTKYDRVLERAEERGQKLIDLKSQLQNFLKGRRVMVLGSAWPRDLEEFMSIYRPLKEFCPQIAVVIAPHDLSAENLASMEKMLEGASVCRVSSETYSAARGYHDFLLVDILGDLPELYGIAELAWVGGALHFRVHNVLEPACRGLYVCFGPHFQTSQEAKGLVANNLARVIYTGVDFLEWYKSLSFSSSSPNEAMTKAVLEQKGASDRIMSLVTSPWR
jgi:3-deoxy-D-manno-octulosonic-acid transferase